MRRTASSFVSSTSLGYSGCASTALLSHPQRPGRCACLHEVPSHIYPSPHAESEVTDILPKAGWHGGFALADIICQWLKNLVMVAQAQYSVDADDSEAAKRQAPQSEERPPKRRTRSARTAQWQPQL